MKNLVQAFTDFDQLRNQFGSNLMTIEQNFVSIINRPDDKAVNIILHREKSWHFKRTIISYWTNEPISWKMSKLPNIWSVSLTNSTIIYGLWLRLKRIKLLLRDKKFSDLISWILRFKRSLRWLKISSKTSWLFWLKSSSSFTTWIMKWKEIKKKYQLNT